MVQGDGLDHDLFDTMDSVALAQLLTRMDKMHRCLVRGLVSRIEV
jgi:hypothetical protein